LHWSNWGRDTVEAIVWDINEADALVLDRSMRFSEHETALEQGWLLQELEQRFGYSLDDLARRFDRSVSWVSRRLALVEQLPETVQQRVRAGEISAHVAMKYLAPVARANPNDCQRLADAFSKHRFSSPPGRGTLRGLARCLGIDTPPHSGFSRTIFKSAPTGLAAA
jgi:ParB family transcriptional regulator, chromosome partitioning protein